MTPLYTDSEFNQAKSNDLLPLQCKQCGETFHRTKHQIQQFFNPNNKRKGDFCSTSCGNKFRTTITTTNCFHCGKLFDIHPYRLKNENVYCSRKCQAKQVGINKRNKQKVICTNCGKEFEKLPKEIKKSKSGNHFCSKSCSASYNNKHKKHGNRRSKLEKWLEEQLSTIHPELTILFNDKTIIESELDIYIPSLNLAFEINGIFHYEPIFGEDKLNQIQSNDKNKYQLCLENKIDLCIIDTSQQKYVKPSTSQKYLDIILQIIKERLNNYMI